MEIDINDVVAELQSDELGRAKWEAAVARVHVRTLQAELARMSNEQQAARTGQGEPGA